MAVLVNENTKVICKGFTGSQGIMHSEHAVAQDARMIDRLIAADNVNDNAEKTVTATKG